MNMYWRRSEQLKNYLLEKEIPVDKVARCNVGFKSFYHIEFNISDEDYTLEIGDKIMSMGDILGVVGIGLVDFDEFKGRVHEVFIVDEDELHNKYLVGEDLIF